MSQYQTKEVQGTLVNFYPPKSSKDGRWSMVDMVIQTTVGQELKVRAMMRDGESFDYHKGDNLLITVSISQYNGRDTYSAFMNKITKVSPVIDVGGEDTSFPFGEQAPDVGTSPEVSPSSEPPLNDSNEKWGDFIMGLQQLQETIANCDCGAEWRQAIAKDCIQALRTDVGL